MSADLAIVLTLLAAASRCSRSTGPHGSVALIMLVALP
jgi:hypothetical protein